MDDLQGRLAVESMLYVIGKVLYGSSDKLCGSGRGQEKDVDSPSYIIDIADIIVSAADLKHLSFEDPAKDRGENAPQSRASGKKEPGPAASVANFKRKDFPGFATGKKGRERDPAAGSGGIAPLWSVFNKLNGNDKSMHYAPQAMDEKGRINYPTEQPVAMDNAFQSNFENWLRETFGGLSDNKAINAESINYLLSRLEVWLAYAPSSTDPRQPTDVSLYDHLKLTTALAGCILSWLRAEKIKDYRKELFTEAERFLEKEAFCLFSMDISGIQSFIYQQFGTEDVLKNLRARSFYLEIMMERFVDILLQKTGLSRANLIYSGGGHAYLLLPNTKECCEAAEAFSGNANAWLQENFGTDLFLGTGIAPCSARTLENVPEGSYGELFRTVSRKISYSKSHRYSAAQIRALNKGKKRDGARECRICHRSDKLTEEGLCGICSGLTKLSPRIMNQKATFFVVRNSEDGEGQIPIYEGEFLSAMDMAGLGKAIKGDSHYICSYTKNDMGGAFRNDGNECLNNDAQGAYMADEKGLWNNGSEHLNEKVEDAYKAGEKGLRSDDNEHDGNEHLYNRSGNGYGSHATRLWVADYSSAGTLQELVENGKGISRLGVIRADVDNLGTAFVSGFPREYQTLTRAASFSRMLSMFFKWHVNALLRDGGYRLEDGGTDIRGVSGASDSLDEAGNAPCQSEGRNPASDDSNSPEEKKGAGPRNATVIYAGGDDLFIVGAWKDIIEFAVDLHRSLDAFSIGTLKISAGIGMFNEKYPISYIASQCEELESASKGLEGKDAVTLFMEEGNTYKWDEFIDEVLGEKFRMLYSFFSFSHEASERGKTFLYRILELFRDTEDRINLARLAYLLARLEPAKKPGDRKAEEYARLYSEFRKKLYQWQRNEKDRKQFVTAAYIYAYLNRGEV